MHLCVYVWGFCHIHRSYVFEYGIITFKYSCIHGRARPSLCGSQLSTNQYFRATLHFTPLFLYDRGVKSQKDAIPEVASMRSFRWLTLDESLFDWSLCILTNQIFTHYLIG